MKTKNHSQETKSPLIFSGKVNSGNDSSPDTFKEPLDKKIRRGTCTVCNSPLGNWFKPEDIKSSLSNLKKRLKEEMEESVYSEQPLSETCGVIDKLFSEEIGSGLLEGENEYKRNTTN